MNKTTYEDKKKIAANSAAADHQDAAAQLKPTPSAAASVPGTALRGYSSGDVAPKSQSTVGGVKPSAYTSAYSKNIDKILGDIMEGEDFSYDIDGDALYQQYKEQYTKLGQRAMEDTIGKASAMTGGYGNSYAATVGNQAYQGYLSELNNVVPELYQLAYDRFRDKKSDLTEQYALISDRDNLEYDRWRDSVADARYENETAYDREQAEKEWQYRLDRDEIEDDRYENKTAYDREQAEKEWRYRLDRDEIEDARYDKSEKRQDMYDAVDIATSVGDTGPLSKLGIDTSVLDSQISTEARETAIAEAERKAALGGYADLAKLLNMSEEEVRAAYSQSDEGGYTAGDLYEALANVRAGKWDSSDANVIIAAYGEEEFQRIIAEQGNIPGDYSPYGDYDAGEFYDAMSGLYDEYSFDPEGTALKRAAALVRSAGGTDEANEMFRSLFGDKAYYAAMKTPAMSEFEGLIMNKQEFLQRGRQDGGKTYNDYDEYYMTKLNEFGAYNRLTSDEIYDLLEGRGLLDKYMALFG